MNQEEKQEIIESFGNVVELKLIAHLAPVKNDLNEVRQTVYGVKGENGHCGAIKSIKTRLRFVESIAYVGQGVIAAILAFKGKIFG